MKSSLISFVTAACLVMQATAAPAYTPDSRPDHYVPYPGLQPAPVAHHGRRHDSHLDIARRQLPVLHPASKNVGPGRPHPRPPPGQPQKNTGSLSPLDLPGTASSEAAQAPSHDVEPGASSAKSDVPEDAAEGNPASPLGVVSSAANAAGSAPKVASSIFYGLPLGEANNVAGSGEETANPTRTPPKSPATAETDVENDSSTVTGTEKDAAKGGEKDVAKDSKTSEDTAKNDATKAAPGSVPAAAAGSAPEPKTFQPGAPSPQKVGEPSRRPVTRRSVGTFREGRFRQSVPIQKGDHGTF